MEDGNAVLDVLLRHFPVTSKGGEFDLLIVDAYGLSEVDGYVTCTVQSMGYDVAADGSRAVRDIKEQGGIRLLRRSQVEDLPRFERYIEALTRVVHTVPFKNLDWMMPYDFFFPAALDLKRPKTTEQFEDALCAKRRLGKYFAP